MNTNAISTSGRYAINLLEDSNHRLLFLKRSNKAVLGPARWGFPAGHIQSGETPFECALRELDEEIGTDREISLLHEMGPLRDFCYGGIYQVWLFHFLWSSGSIMLNEEHTDYAWIDRDKFRELDRMDGIDEDIAWLGIWPLQYLDKTRIPPHLLTCR